MGTLPVRGRAPCFLFPDVVSQTTSDSVWRTGGATPCLSSNAYLAPVALVFASQSWLLAMRLHRLAVLLTFPDKGLLPS